MALDASCHPNDSFGYSVYAVVAFAPCDQAAKIEGLQRGIGMKRATIPAHVTVKGTFCEIASLQELCRLAGDIAERTVPVQMDFDDDGAPHFTGSSGNLQIRLTPQLTALNAALEQAIGPVSTNAYRDGPFRPHLGLCQDCSAAQIDEAKRLAEELDLGTGFLAASIAFVGRVGPAYGGRWESIAQFSLRG